MKSKIKLTIQETTYIINLLDFRDCALELEKEIFNNIESVEYEQTLIKILKNKCNLIIKDYTI